MNELNDEFNLMGSNVCFPSLIGGFLSNLLPIEKDGGALMAFLVTIYGLRRDFLFVDIIPFDNGEQLLENVVVVLNDVDSHKCERMKNDLIEAVDCEGIKYFNDVLVSSLKYPQQF